MHALAEMRQIRQRSSGTSRRELPLPMSAGLRVAQVSARGLLFGDARFFALDQPGALQSFQPQVLIGSTAELETLARQACECALDLSSIDRALLVVTDCRDMPLRDSSRVTLWKAFGVPTFEFLLGSDGIPIACECEAHEGWHVENGVNFSTVNGQLWFQRKREMAQGTGLTGEIDETLCACGQPSKRIRNAAMDYRDAVRHSLAKTA